MRNTALVLFIIIALFSCKKNKIIPAGNLIIDTTYTTPPVIDTPQTMQPITIQGKDFVGKDGKKFIPWGFQYTNTDAIGLMEDNWYADTTWARIKQDFKDMKGLGANIIRIHLEYNKFMVTATGPNARALNRLKELVDYAEQIGVYLDVTGLACYRASDTPPWYDAMNETDRWATQAVFWQAVAKTIGHNNNVMAYNLINEPVVPATPTTTWLPGAPLGGYNFIQNITRDPKGRTTDSVFKVWINQMTTAIRKVDTRTFITVGFLPLGNIAAYSNKLDYISTHIYPQTGQIQQQIDFVVTNTSQATKPLIIEEFYGLFATTAEMNTFINQTEPIVAGYISYYDGNNMQALAQCPTIGCAIQAEWIKYFMGLNPNK